MTANKEQQTASEPAMGGSSGAPSFTDETIRIWQPYYQRELTREDAREIAHNVIGFFRVLKKWADEERRNNAAQKTSASDASAKHDAE